VRFKITVFFCLYLLMYAAIAQDASTCKSPYAGKTLSQKELQHILSAHAKTGNVTLNLCGTVLSNVTFDQLQLPPINLFGADVSNTSLRSVRLSDSYLVKTYFRWSDLSGANLRNSIMTSASFKDTTLINANLQQGNLENADFTDADAKQSDFSGANLRNADLRGADLSHANLAWTDLSGANLQEAKLNDANLDHANLTGATLKNSDLSHTYLTQANLSKADLTGATLTQANFSHATLQHTIFQPKLNTLPNIVTLATAKHFDTIEFHTSKMGVPALAELRSAYKAAGLRSMERLITSMLKQQQMAESWDHGGWGYLESALNYVFFYLTCDFGLKPGRALLILLLLIVVFSIPYRMALWLAQPHAGIWANWKKQPTSLHNIEEDADTHQLLLKQHTGTIWQKRMLAEVRNLRISLYFSVLTAFQIGWQELNVSNWISRMQRKEYRLQAKGWVRIIAGIQSLISAYLLVMWALAYFGRPFEW